VYGVRTPTFETAHLKRTIRVLELWISVMEHGAHPPVDLIPALKWIPERFWRHWKSKTAECTKEMNGLYNDLLAMVVKRRKTTGPRRSVADGMLDQQDKLGLTWSQQYFIAGVLVEAGSETTASIILIFLQAMIKYPEVQKKAHMHIDEIVGEDRSPLWSDYKKLPYLAQIIKEVFRWRPVAPLAFPHYLTEGKLSVWMCILVQFLKYLQYR
jgi:cytochrome P450